MKKIILFFLCLLSLTCFSACGNTNLPDFKDCKVGYQLEVYPKVSFDYKFLNTYQLPTFTEGIIIHFDKINATLSAKNEINKGDILEKHYRPYEISFEVSGNIDTRFLSTSKNLYVSLVWGDHMSIDIKCAVNSDGAFAETYTYGMNENRIIYFSSVLIM